MDKNFAKDNKNTGRLMSKMTRVACTVLVVLTCPIIAMAQNTIRFQALSSGASATEASNGTTKLYSAIGQPAARSSTTLTETQAGFLQVSNYVVIDNDAPAITYTTTAQGITQGAASSLTATITDNIKVTAVKLFYRPVSAATFNSVNILGSNNTFSIALQEAWHDAVGMEYYFTAADASGNSDRSPKTGSYYAYLTNPSVIVPQLTAGPNVTNYHIVAMPYSSEGGDDISKIFGSASGLPVYADTKWRLAAYDNSKSTFIEPATGLTKFERGKGYWFITKTWPQGGLNLGQKAASANNRASLYSITLKPGWNHIGNPYPVPVKWSEVQKLTGNPSVSSIKVYEGGWADGDEIAPFQGGFVKNTGSVDVVVKIPFKGQTAEGGRQQNTAPGSDISAESWRVDLHIFQSAQFNKIGGFGMTPDSRADEDNTDDYNPPGFINSPEVNFYRSDISRLKLAKDMVPTDEKFTWKFKVEGEYEMPTELKWSKDLGSGDQELFLLDEVSLQRINMREQSAYQFTLLSIHGFTIFFGKNISGETGPDQVSVAGPFPNPVVNKNVTFNLGLPQAKSLFDVNLKIFTATGVTIHSDQKNLGTGIHELNWIADDFISGGLFYYRIQVRSVNASKIFTGKIIVP